MTTTPFGAGYTPDVVGTMPIGSHRIRKVSLVAAADVSDWIRVDGPCNVLCDGGTTFTVQVYRATESDQSDDVLVDTQSETDRSGFYDFIGPGYLKIILSALSAGGPVVVRVASR